METIIKKGFETTKSGEAIAATAARKVVEAKNNNRSLQEMETAKAIECHRSGAIVKSNSSDDNNRSCSFLRRGGKEVLAIDCSGRGCRSERLKAAASGTNDKHSKLTAKQARSTRACPKRSVVQQKSPVTLAGR